MGLGLGLLFGGCGWVTKDSVVLWLWFSIGVAVSV